VTLPDLSDLTHNFKDVSVSSLQYLGDVLIPDDRPKTRKEVHHFMPSALMGDLSSKGSTGLKCSTSIPGAGGPLNKNQILLFIPVV